MLRKNEEYNISDISFQLGFSSLNYSFLYLIGLHFVGFVYSTPVIMLLVSLVLGLRHWLAGLAAYIAFTLAVNYAAFHFMQIILPTGVLFG